MKGQNKWGYQPYTPVNAVYKRRLPHICRLAPGEDYAEFEWQDKGGGEKHFVFWKPVASTENYSCRELKEQKVKLLGLSQECDYEFYVTRENKEEKSDIRFFRTGKAIGTVVNYLHPQDTAFAYSGRYLCSPSLVKLPSGALLASMDVFVSHGPQNLTFLFRSSDDGATWEYVTDLFPCFWGKLFCHKDALYMLATSTEYGSLLIGKSLDEGYTWSEAVTILPGS